VQVPQVTEEVAMAVLDCYPTLYSLACAYSLLVSLLSPFAASDSLTSCGGLVYPIAYTL